MLSPSRMSLSAPSVPSRASAVADCPTHTIAAVRDFESLLNASLSKDLSTEIENIMASCIMTSQQRHLKAKISTPRPVRVRSPLTSPKLCSTWPSGKIPDPRVSFVAAGSPKTHESKPTSDDGSVPRRAQIPDVNLFEDNNILISNSTSPQARDQTDTDSPEQSRDEISEFRLELAALQRKFDTLLSTTSEEQSTRSDLPNPPTPSCTAQLSAVQSEPTGESPVRQQDLTVVWNELQSMRELVLSTIQQPAPLAPAVHAPPILASPGPMSPSPRVSARAPALADILPAVQQLVRDEIARNNATLADEIVRPEVARQVAAAVATAAAAADASARPPRATAVGKAGSKTNSAGAARAAATSASVRPLVPPQPPPLLPLKATPLRNTHGGSAAVMPADKPVERAQVRGGGRRGGLLNSAGAPAAGTTAVARRAAPNAVGKAEDRWRWQRPPLFRPVRPAPPPPPQPPPPRRTAAPAARLRSAAGKQRLALPGGNRGIGLTSAWRLSEWEGNEEDEGEDAELAEINYEADEDEPLDETVLELEEERDMQDSLEEDGLGLRDIEQNVHQLLGQLRQSLDHKTRLLMDGRAAYASMRPAGTGSRPSLRALQPTSIVSRSRGGPSSTSGFRSTPRHRAHASSLPSTSSYSRPTLSSLSKSQH
ncbi:hypothetical protein DFJ73DRAFT_490815 [Zopfochytrium polystomum]|nr:hypothetical protein DFJ73DRAFT_490815 [Zopfochytrium polystomum]